MKKFGLFTALAMATMMAVAPVSTVMADPIGEGGPGTSGVNLSGNGDGTSAGYTPDATTGIAEAESIAQFEVTGGNLTLDAVPNLQFETVNAGDLATGKQRVPLANFSIDAGEDGWDGNQSGRLQVTDNRGENVGWRLFATMSPFKEVDPKDGNPVELEGNLDLKFNATSEVKRDATIKAGTEANLVWSAVPGNGQGKNFSIVKIDGSELEITSNSNVRHGIYRATILWELNNTPVEGTTPEPEPEP